MKLRILYSLCLLSTIAIFSSSCDDEKDGDLADQAVGTYDYEVTVYVLDGDDLIELEDVLAQDIDISGTADVSKNESKGIVVEEDGDLIFEGQDLVSASGGFTFEIDDQDIELDGSELPVEGYEGIDNEFHGEYKSSSKELTGWMMAENVLIEIDGEVYEVTLVFEFKGEKDS
jgi:hypothetical protein